MDHKEIKNPLFESLWNTVKRYEVIQEDSKEYKLKSAKDYANKILQLAYSQYVYFASSVPSYGLKKDLLKNSLAFMDQQASKPNLTLKDFLDGLFKQWESASGSIMADGDLLKLPEVKEMYLKVGEGMNALKQVLETYEKRYGSQAADPSILTMVKDFITNATTALKEKNKK